MVNLLVGFVGMVLIPVLILSLLLTRWNAEDPRDFGFQDDHMR